MIQLVVLLAAVGLLALAQHRVALVRMRETLRAKSRRLDEPALRAIVERLADAAGATGLEPAQFEADVVNGLATPDGRVYLTTALVAKLRAGLVTPDEVGSVVAHELGHVALGHHGRRLVDWTGQSVAAMALGALLNRVVPILGFYVAGFVARLLMARLSRRDEFEADRYATALMLKAGVDPAAQVSMLRKLERLVPGPRPEGWLASHPPVPERVAAIEANVAGWRAARPG